MCELLWIRILLQDLHIEQTNPIKLYCDNKTAYDIAHNPVQHDHIKHVEIDRYFIKDNLVSIQNKLLEFELKISMLTTKKLTQKYKAKKMKR